MLISKLQTSTVWVQDQELDLNNNRQAGERQDDASQARGHKRISTASVNMAYESE